MIFNEYIHVGELIYYPKQGEYSTAVSFCWPNLLTTQYSNVSVRGPDCLFLCSVLHLLKWYFIAGNLDFAQVGFKLITIMMFDILNLHITRENFPLHIL